MEDNFEKGVKNLYQFKGNHLEIAVDFEAGHLSSLVVGGRSCLRGSMPLFRVRVRNLDGESAVVTAYDAKRRVSEGGRAVYECFEGSAFGALLHEMRVTVTLEEQAGEAAWGITVDPGCDSIACEWVDFPRLTLPCLKENDPSGAGGSVLFPFNEGVLVSDIERKEDCGFRYEDPEYPSKGSFAMFPNMVCSQMLAYVWEDACLYLGAHDAKRAPKGLDMIREADGVALQMRLLCGVEFGMAFATDYPIVWAVTAGGWESAAERYRAWLECNLPAGACRVTENPKLPAWYEDSPLIISYPIRGWFDTDVMEPNAFYPYTNAIATVEEIAKATGCRIMVLLMHWEGTAPWAPPFVWPPYGDKENFDAFLQYLHDRGDLLGVYCSGFGYTTQSKLVAEYNGEAKLLERGLIDGMCAGPDGKVAFSNICRAQRRGYDICPASEVGRRLLDEAYSPLFESGLDYVQILDQNHGGGQYFCYSKEHGHPPTPGAWMTERMQEMLSDWNKRAPNMLFGCESAAAEPFIGNLRFSDNRFELNYKLGQPVPLYAYLYHEYVRNFMGNQVSCPLEEADSLAYRIAHAFAAGDCMTLVLMPNGEVMSWWGMRDFSIRQDKAQLLRMIGNLNRFYQNEAKPYLYAGRMIKGEEMECETVTYVTRQKTGQTITLPALHTTAWESAEGKRVQIVVNPKDREMTCRIGERAVTVPALDAVMIEI